MGTYILSPHFKLGLCDAEAIQVYKQYYLSSLSVSEWTLYDFDLKRNLVRYGLTPHPVVRTACRLSISQNHEVALRIGMRWRPGPPELDWDRF